MKAFSNNAGRDGQLAITANLNSLKQELFKLFETSANRQPQDGDHRVQSPELGGPVLTIRSK